MRHRLITVVAVAALAAPAAAAGGDIELPERVEFTLDSGLEVFVVPVSEGPLVTMRLLVPAGSCVDPGGGEGLAGITARLLVKGAGGMGADEMAESVEGRGGRLEAWAGRDYSIVTGDFLSRDFEFGLHVLALAATKPDFPADEFERERSMVLAEAEGIRENPGALAGREFLEYLLGPGPYAHPVDGYPSSVKKLALSDVTGFHRRYYVPTGAVLAVVGDVDAERVKTLVRRELGGWKGAPPPGTRVVPLQAKQGGVRRVIVIDKPGLTQSQIRIGNIAAARNTPDYFALTVANGILGGGFTSRLMEEIRVNRGLSYGARSRLGMFRYGGYFGVTTHTKNETLRETIDVALDQIRGMREGEVGEEELEGCKRYISGLFPFRIETNADIAAWLTDMAFYGLGGDFVEKYRGRIEAVSAGDVLRAARKYFLADGNLVLVLTDYSVTGGMLEGLGEVTVIPVDEVE